MMSKGYKLLRMSLHVFVILQITKYNGSEFVGATGVCRSASSCQRKGKGHLKTTSGWAAQFCVCSTFCRSLRMGIKSSSFSKTVDVRLDQSGNINSTFGSGEIKNMDELRLGGKHLYDNTFITFCQYNVILMSVFKVIIWKPQRNYQE